MKQMNINSRKDQIQMDIYPKSTTKECKKEINNKQQGELPRITNFQGQSSKSYIFLNHLELLKHDRNFMIGSKVFLIPCYLFNELIEGVSDTLLLFFFGSYDWI